MHRNDLSQFVCGAFSNVGAGFPLVGGDDDVTVPNGGASLVGIGSVVVVVTVIVVSVCARDGLSGGILMMPIEDLVSPVVGREGCDAGALRIFGFDAVAMDRFTDQFISDDRPLIVIDGCENR